MKLSFLWIVISLVLVGCRHSDHQTLEDEDWEAVLTHHSQSLPLHKIVLPDGFKIDVFAEVNDARSMTQSPSGVIYVGNKDGDKVYAVTDTNNDHKADKRWVIASGLNMPNGVAFKDGALYVAEVDRILKFPEVEKDLNNPPQPIVINDQYPSEKFHGWRYIAFGPKGRLYVPVGSPCNICESEEIYASITRIDDDGSNREIYAHGVRNTVGFTWHPVTEEMWFTDNGRDMLGDDIPPCELNRITKAGMHFGYPYCHGGDLKDPDFGNKRQCNEFIMPARRLGPHVAPLGVKFNTGKMFPAIYKNNLFIAEHGSWNRSEKTGYRVSLVKIENNSKATSYETFASGWLDEEKQESWGRPVDVLFLPDGSMLISDDQAGVIYRVSYEK